MVLREQSIPVRESVKGACEVLGLDPLYVANEGKLLAIVAPERAEAVLRQMRQHELGQGCRHHRRGGCRAPGHGADEDADWRHQGAGCNVRRTVASHLLSFFNFQYCPVLGMKRNDTMLRLTELFLVNKLSGQYLGLIGETLISPHVFSMRQK